MFSLISKAVSQSFRQLTKEITGGSHSAESAGGLRNLKIPDASSSSSLAGKVLPPKDSRSTAEFEDINLGINNAETLNSRF